MSIGLIVIGDEILSGKRVDKHMPELISMLLARGLQLEYVEYVGDSPQRITETLRRAFASKDLVFSTGGIGATPDDHTRLCAAQALGVALELHPTAKTLIVQRMQILAQERSEVFDPQHPDNVHRLNMGMFPRGAHIIENPFNGIPGFSCGSVYFVPGFPVMAWPMIQWVLDTHYAHLFRLSATLERSVIVFGALEASLTPLMLDIERRYPVKVFSLPSVDHPEYGRHVELGVKGDPVHVENAYAALRLALEALPASLGPEVIRKL